MQPDWRHTAAMWLYSLYGEDVPHRDTAIRARMKLETSIQPASDLVEPGRAVDDRTIKRTLLGWFGDQTWHGGDPYEALGAC